VLVQGTGETLNLPTPRTLADAASAA